MGQKEFARREMRLRQESTKNYAIAPQIYFKAGFPTFVATMARQLGIEEPEGRQLGTGLRDLALLLTQVGHHTLESKPLRPTAESLSLAAYVQLCMVLR